VSNTQNIKPYSEVRGQIRDGDLLLKRGKGPISWAISVAGRSPWTHAGMACWWHDDLFLLEVQWTGGRAVLLSTQVKRYPGQWNVFVRKDMTEMSTHEFARASARFMRRLCGCSYGFAGLAAAALLHLPLVRCFVPADTDDQARDHRPPFCSQACAMAYRIGGEVDPVPELADRLTEPGDLSRSPYFRYRFTLGWEGERRT